MPSLRSMRFVTLCAGLATLCLLIAAPAQATHPRPAGATPVRVSLVPAYDPCTAPNRTHGPPLAFPSCNLPAQSSSSLTVGTPDANGAGANSTSFVKLTAILGPVGPPGDGDIAVVAQSTDVRCKAGTTTCGNANAVDGADYVGELALRLRIRLTDHFNAVAAGGGNDPATVADFPFDFPVPCANTSDTAIGGLCTVHTSFEAIMPGSVERLDAKRAVFELEQVRVDDGGADGDGDTTADNTVFARPGIFIP
jgi:hypothetical protein